MSNPASGSVKVLYIMGFSRSGSTILDNILNELDGFFSAGELRFLWKRILERRWCACGLPIDKCTVWSRILRHAYGDQGPSPSELARFADLQRAVSGAKQTIRLVNQARRRHSGSEPFREYAHLVATLYRSIAEVTGASVIVDSSKRPSDGALLALIPDVAPYYVHLVRDPRAVAFSQQRRKLNPVAQKPVPMPRANSLQSTFLWSSWNLGADLVRRRNIRRSIVIRYEDFASDPRSTIETITRFVQEKRSTHPIWEGGAVRLRGNHSVSGNPTRFTSGLMKIQEDDEWIASMPLRQRLLVSSLTIPLLRAYGYPFHVGRKPAQHAHNASR